MITNVMERLIDFTRTSGGGYFGADGLFRFTPASRNLLTYTQELDNGAWVKGNATVTANAVAAPDGTLTADAVLPTATTAAHNVQQAGGGSGTPLALSVYAKAGTLAFMQLSHGSNSTIYANFDLLTGTVGTVGANATATIMPAGDGWYRCAMTFMPGGAANLAIGHITSATAGHRESWAATGTESIYLWGAQLELASAASDYTRNVGGLYPPRFDYDPVTLAPRGLLIEEQRTNLLLRSKEFENAAWAKVESTVSANAAASPDGTVDADKFIPSTNAAGHYINQSVTPTTAQCTGSVYVKLDGSAVDKVTLFPGGSSAFANFNLSTLTSAGEANVASTSIVNVGDGWYRLSATWVAGALVDRLRIYASSGSTGAAAAAGDGTSGIYLWGAQLEAGAFPTSYIPTAASQVTRAADNAVITGANFSRWYIASEGTWVVEFDCSASSSALSADDATNNNFIRLGRLNNTGSLRVFSGGVEQADITPANAPGWLGSVKLAAAYKANDFAASASGGTVSTDTVGAIPTVAQLRIGASGASDYVNGHIRSVRYFPTRLSNTKLQELTA